MICTNTAYKYMRGMYTLKKLILIHQDRKTKFLKYNGVKHDPENTLLEKLITF